MIGLRAFYIEQVNILRILYWKIDALYIFNNHKRRLQKKSLSTIVIWHHIITNSIVINVYRDQKFTKEELEI